MNRIRNSGFLSVVVAAMLMISTGSQAVYAESTISMTEPVSSAVQSGLPFKDIKGHWAEQSIVRGYEKGYIEVSAKGTFEPNKPITREEFVVMLMRAQRRVISNADHEGAYIFAARDQGLFDQIQYNYEWWGGYPQEKEPTRIYMTSWDKPIRKHQLAHIAVRALGKDEKIQDDMYDAIRYGLIGGGADGKLNPAENTTRAQAAVVIDRILRIEEGESLPADPQALAMAEKVKLAKKDPWGRVIRTTNLPKGYQNFPYVLEEWPNEMYNLNHSFKEYNFKMTPAQFTDIRSWDDPNDLVYNTDVISRRAEFAEQYANLLLNVDYTKLDESWMDKIMALVNPADLDYINRQMEPNLKEYIAAAKKNKVQVRGSAKAEPSIMFVDGDTFVRVHFTFKATSFTDRKKIFFDPHPDFYTHVDFYKSVVLKKNVEYEAYVNIAMSDRGYDGGTLENGAIAQAAFLFEDAIVKEKK